MNIAFTLHTMHPSEWETPGLIIIHYWRASCFTRPSMKQEATCSLYPLLKRLNTNLHCESLANCQSAKGMVAEGRCSTVTPSPYIQVAVYVYSGYRSSQQCMAPTDCRTRTTSCFRCMVIAFLMTYVYTCWSQQLTSSGRRSVSSRSVRATH